MRFMLLLIPGVDAMATAQTTSDVDAVAAMACYHQQLHEAGVLITLDGLHPPSRGARVSFAAGKPEVIEGPSMDTYSMLGGYWMIEVASRAQAIDWAARYPAEPGDVIEVRQVQEFTDVPPELQRVLIGEVGGPDDQDQPASMRQRRTANA